MTPSEALKSIRTLVEASAALKDDAQAARSAKSGDPRRHHAVVVGREAAGD
jgi:hypothetical protein